MKSTTLALVFVAATWSALAENTHRHHEAHVHGHAKLNLAISGGTIQLELTSPAMNLVGFEHAPSSGKDHRLVKEAVDFLDHPANWIHLVGDKGCKVSHLDLETSLLRSHLHGDHHHEGHHHETHKPDGHADFEISAEFKCENAQQLEQVDLTGLFKRFTGFKSIEVQWLTDRLQSATTLDINNPIISVH